MFGSDKKKCYKKASRGDVASMEALAHDAVKNETKLREARAETNDQLNLSKLCISERFLAYTIYQASTAKFYFKFSSRLKKVNKLLIKAKYDSYDVDEPACILMPYRIRALKKFDWRHDDTSPSHRAQKRMKALVEAEDNEGYIRLLQTMKISDQPADNRVCHLILLDHINDESTAAIMITEIVRLGALSLLQTMLDLAESEEHYQRLADGVVDHWLENKENTELLYQCAKKCKGRNKSLLRALKINYLLNPNDANAAWHYFLQLKTMPRDMINEGHQLKIETLLMICFKLGHKNAGYKLSCMWIDEKVLGFKIDEAFDLLFKILKKTSNKSLQKKCLAKLEENFHYVSSKPKYIKMLSDIYRHGYGCEADEMRAITYDRALAVMGDTEAFVRCYGDDLSVSALQWHAKNDCAAALKLLDRKARAGDEAAEVAWRTCRESGHGAVRVEFVSEERDAPYVEREITVPDDDFERSIQANRNRVRFFDGSGYFYLQKQCAISLARLGVNDEESIQLLHYINFSTSIGGHADTALNQVLVYSAGMDWPGLRKEYRSQMAEVMADIRWSVPLFGRHFDAGRQKTVVEGLLPRLNEGRVVSMGTGWVGHEINLAFFKVGDEYFMSYANKGESNLSQSAIRFYRMSADGIAKLSDPEWLDDICNYNFSKDYMDNHDADSNGLGKDLGLSEVAVIERKDQNGSNCTLVATHHAVLTGLMIKQFQAQLAPLADAATVDIDYQAQAQQAFDAVFQPAYKPWRFYLRVAELQNLCGLGDCRQRVHIPPQYHIPILFKVIDVMAKKYSGHDARSVSHRTQLLTVLINYMDSPACDYSEEQKTGVRDYMVKQWPVSAASTRLTA